VEEGEEQEQGQGEPVPFDKNVTFKRKRDE